MSAFKFRNTLAETAFYTKYAQGQDDTWPNLARRLVDDVCGQTARSPALMSKEDRAQLTEYIARMYFLPGGRYLYYAGRQMKAYNNCGVASTRVLTDKGWARMGDVVGQTLNILSPVDGTYRPAKFHAHGVQPVQDIIFAPLRGRSHQRYTVRFTPNHKWQLIDGTTTENLAVGDIVSANRFSAGNHPLAFIHGFVFGDGNEHGQLRLCGERKQAYLNDFEAFGTVTYPPSADGDPVLYFGKSDHWKQMPDSSDAAYVASFIEGWLAADGHEDRQLSSVNRAYMEWFREHAAFAGLVVSGELRSQVRDITIGEYKYKDHEIFFQNYARGVNWPGFKVESITQAGAEEVYCPFEPVYNQIVIDHGIQTFQCYLLRAEEDTREEWASLAQRAMACLMLGGGIGVDYSRLRRRGEILKRTGGVASGPLPLMYSIDSIGNNVMQGGSRRSAIYASLNWQHPDIRDFLVAKNWEEMPIKGTDFTLWDWKQYDFNAPAPLHMTNISANYDDAWRNTPERFGHPTFAKNVEQALRTGEPGFSFNFGDKQNETLRNACTEITSSDDSDVCNLGSVNMAAVPDAETFKDVVRLAAKFLVCGTIRADLPYDKVYEVRQKNRRLGLGLMGMHEWLMARRLAYAVGPELQSWLKIYERESKSAADEHCDRLFLSRPVAYRAIAPTGTIGILAGTTTGIEPLYAVAYKRRYLKNGDQWHYQYVIDSTAQQLIKDLGVEPDAIETATNLAQDPEKRIAFQADVQDYVDHAISSTINLPQWGTEYNNPDRVKEFARILSKYAPRLRGFTCYPDAGRGGQPIVAVPYAEAAEHAGAEYREHDACEIGGKAGVCGI